MKARLTPKAIEALVWARDHGTAWQYAPGKSLAWSSARSRMLNDLAGKGFLVDASGRITEAGRAEIARAEGIPY